MSSGLDDTLTNLARPKTSAIITVRVIKSFEFRTERSLVLRDINLETTTIGNLKEIARNRELGSTCARVLCALIFFPFLSSKSIPGCQTVIQTQPGWKPYRPVHLGLPHFSLATRAKDMR